MSLAAFGLPRAAALPSTPTWSPSQRAAEGIELPRVSTGADGAGAAADIAAEMEPAPEAGTEAEGPAVSSAELPAAAHPLRPQPLWAAAPTRTASEEQLIELCPVTPGMYFGEIPSLDAPMLGPVGQHDAAAALFDVLIQPMAVLDEETESEDDFVLLHTPTPTPPPAPDDVDVDGGDGGTRFADAAAEFDAEVDAHFHRHYQPAAWRSAQHPPHPRRRLEPGTPEVLPPLHGGGSSRQRPALGCAPTPRCDQPRRSMAAKFSPAARRQVMAAPESRSARAVTIATRAFRDRAASASEDAAAAMRGMQCRDENGYCGFSADLIGLNTVEFNRYVKLVTMAIDEVNECKKARRRWRNKGYAAGSRLRKAAQSSQKAGIGRHDHAARNPAL